VILPGSFLGKHQQVGERAHRYRRIDHQHLLVGGDPEIGAKSLRGSKPAALP